MAIDRDRLEHALDRLLAAYGRKVRAAIDAGAGGTRADFVRSHRAEDAYWEARAAFFAEVCGPPPADGESLG